MANRTALIIEDNENIADIYSSALMMAGFAPEIVGDGQKALDHLGKTIPDLIVLDMNLPQVSGHYVYKRIRADSRLDHVPVIISTANAVLASALADELAPQDKMLMKPISPADLRDLAKSL